MKYRLMLCFSACLLAMAATMTVAAALPPGVMRIDGTPAPALQLDNLDGAAYDLKATHGHWRFVHFWASWCGPCREEMPAVQKLSEVMQGKNFQIVMINTAEDEDTIFEFLSTISVELNSLMDVDGTVTEVWKPRGLPTTFLISPKGEVKYQAIGGRDWDKPEYVGFLNTLLLSADKP